MSTHKSQVEAPDIHPAAALLTPRPQSPTSDHGNDTTTSSKMSKGLLGSSSKKKNMAASFQSKSTASLRRSLLQAQAQEVDKAAFKAYRRAPKETKAAPHDGHRTDRSGASAKAVDGQEYLQRLH